MAYYITVLPYSETSRLFHASKTTQQESYIGESGIVYYQHQAKRMNKEDAINSAKSSLNTNAFVREIKE